MIAPRAQPTLAPPPTAAAASALLCELGGRVRQARTQQALTRRELAGRSQVSERYLAHLEAGDGNASLRVLHRIAAALGTSLPALVTADVSQNSELNLILAQLRDLPVTTLTEIRTDLERRYRGVTRARAERIALIGLRGAGKSTLGQRLAAHTDRPFIELDQAIERAAGASLSEIFLMYGQAGYRRYEVQTLQQVFADHPACVIATGGSIVSEAETFALLLTHCYTVWLKATPEEHMARVIAQGDLRPMTGKAEAMDDLRRILHERASGYAQADATVDTAGRPINAAFAALIHALGPRLGAL